MVHHDKAELLKTIASMPENCFKDGVLIDIPKRRRREQAQGKRPMTIKMAADHKRRFGVQFNRFVEIFGKDTGIEVMMGLLEHPSDERLRALAQTEETFDKERKGDAGHSENNEGGTGQLGDHSDGSGFPL